MARKRMTEPIETTDANGEPITVSPPRDPAKAPVYIVMSMDELGRPCAALQRFRTIGAVRKFMREYPDMVAMHWGNFCVVRASKIDRATLNKIVTRNRKRV